MAATGTMQAFNSPDCIRCRNSRRVSLPSRTTLFFQLCRRSGRHSFQGISVRLDALGLRQIFGDDFPSGAHFAEFSKVARLVGKVQMGGVQRAVTLET